MPLEILALMVVVGLALVIGTVHLKGGSKSPDPLTDKDAVERYLVDFPGSRVSEVVLSRDGKIAILALHGTDSVGLVEQMGIHRLTRTLDRQNVEKVSTHDAAIQIQLRDATLPTIEFEASDPLICEKLLNPLCSPEGG